MMCTCIDPSRCSVRVIKSERTGMGKSLYISGLEKKLEKRLERKYKKEIKYPLRAIIPIHGPDVDLDAVLRHLQHHMINVDPINPPAQIFHFDVAPSVSLIYRYELSVLNQVVFHAGTR